MFWFTVIIKRIALSLIIMKNIKYWSGSKIDKLSENEIFVFGSNPVLSFQ